MRISDWSSYVCSSDLGYGFTAIIVAFLGRLHPLGIVLSGLLVALSYIGGETAQVEVGLPQAVTGVFQGLLLFFLLASDFLVCYRLRLRPAGTPSPRGQVEIGIGSGRERGCPYWKSLEVAVYQKQEKT